MASSVKNKTKENYRHHNVQSVDRALDLLESFPKIGPEVGLTTMADHLGLNKATAYRLLSTLEDRGYLERSPNDRKYRLGVKLFELGAYYQNQINVRSMALPYLSKLVDETRQAAFLCIREGIEALCVESKVPDHGVKIFALRVGGRLPLHTGAGPRILIAGFNHEEIVDYSKRTGLPVFTPKSISNLDDLLTDVKQTLDAGYTISMEDVTPGLAAIGAPIRDFNGGIIASISISGMVSHFDQTQQKKLAKSVVRIAQEVSRHMGYIGN